jgi:hypothetical protein
LKKKITIFLVLWNARLETSFIPHPVLGPYFDPESYLTHNTGPDLRILDS